jgi:uncharacterized protein (TIRG00374 family)
VTAAAPVVMRQLPAYAERLAAADPTRARSGGATPHRRRMTRTQSALIAASLVVSLLFGYVAVRDAHPRQTLDALGATDIGWLLPALALLVLAFFLRAIRWWSLFPRQTRPSLRAVTAALFVGYLANTVLPLRAGDAAAVVALNRRTGRTIAETTGTMLVQRAQDVLSLVLLLFLMLPWLPHVSWLRVAGTLGIVLLGLLAVVAVVVTRFGDSVVRPLLRPLRSLPFVAADALERAPTQFVQGLAGVVRPRVALASFAWTTASWIVVGAAYWFVLEATGIELSPLAGLLVVIGIGLAMILPSSPAALGVFEGATVVVLAAYNVAASTALSYALVLHALNVVPLLVVGLVLLGRRQLTLRSDAPASSAARV